MNGTKRRAAPTSVGDLVFTNSIALGDVVAVRDGIARVRYDARGGGEFYGLFSCHDLEVATPLAERAIMQETGGRA